MGAGGVMHYLKRGLVHLAQDPLELNPVLRDFVILAWLPFALLVDLLLPDPIMGLFK
jgi:hypothetical protein